MIRSVSEKGRVLFYSATYSDETKDKIYSLLGENL